MLEQINQLDREFILFVNQGHWPITDFIMYWASDTKIWIPLYILLAGLMVWKLKTKSIIYLLGIALVITLSDQFTSSFMKPYFGRLRPCHEPALQYMLHLPAGCGGKFGFASSHAANTFGLAMFMWLLFKNHFRSMWLLFIWAGIVSFSRVYLAAHYLTDITAGALIGILFAWLVLTLCHRIVLWCKL